MSEGRNPFWCIKFVIFNKKVSINFESSLDDLVGSFQNFYNKHIKHIF